MAQEIERKFLVKGSYSQFVNKSIRITQRYISSAPAPNVRVRIKGDKAYLTIKGMSNASGMSRFEWEKEISIEEAKALLEICEAGIIDKTRHLIEVGDHIYEVDEFHGENEGLTIAEIELRSEDEVFLKPDWLGKEVTGEMAYYNSMLLKKPYKSW